MKAYYVTHTTTSPYHAQSLTQRMIQTMKRVINKLQEPYLAFWEYRKNQEKNFNRHADKEPLKPLDLKAVDPVLMQSQSGQWTSGFVRDLHVHPTCPK